MTSASARGSARFSREAAHTVTHHGRRLDRALSMVGAMAGRHGVLKLPVLESLDAVLDRERGEAHAPSVSPPVPLQSA